MFGYIQFAEDYFPIIANICRSLKKLRPDIQFGGIALKRQTVCAKIDELASELNITGYEWLNSIEKKILSQPFDETLMQHYIERFGSEKLRFLIAVDRELAAGYVSGARLCRSKFGKLSNRRDEERWKYIIGLVDYFVCSFTEHRPDFIFMNETTFAWEAAMHIVAEDMHIPCLTLECLRGCSAYCISDNVFGMLNKRDELYRKSLENPDLLKDFLKQAEENIKAFRERPLPPDYMETHRKNFSKLVSLSGLLRRITVNTAMAAAIKLKMFGTRDLMRISKGRDMLKQSWASYITGRKILQGKWFEQAEPYMDKNYIFYPLHYEPESSTSVACHKLTNQVALIEQISKNMPFGYRLLVKEHIPSIGSRPDGFYERIKAIPDVHLISPFENSMSIVRKAKLVIVLTGTSGWECIQLGIPVMIFGHAEYTGIGTGFMKCDKIINFADEIVQAMHTPPATERELIHFQAAQYACATLLTYDEISAKFYNRDCDKKKSNIYSNQLAKQILDITEEYRQKNMEGEK